MNHPALATPPSMPLQIFRAEKRKPVPTGLETAKHPHTKKKKFTAKSRKQDKNKQMERQSFFHHTVLNIQPSRETSHLVPISGLLAALELISKYDKIKICK